MTIATAVAVEQHRVIVGRDLTIHYHRAGRGEPVLLVHGSGPGTTAWSTYASTFDVLARRFCVVAPDMPGWGESSPMAFDARVHLDALIRFMDEIGFRTAAIVGHSLGGARAMELAATRPERVRKLVLLASPAPGVDLLASSPSEGAKALVAACQDPSTERMTDLLTKICHDPRHVTPELVELMRASAASRPQHLANFLAGVGRPTHSIFATDNPAAGLKQISAPTLVVHGRNDRVVAVEAALRLLASIDDSRAFLFNRCGHWPHVERFDEWQQALVRFLDNNVDAR